jgi:hypothetical protein
LQPLAATNVDSSPVTSPPQTNIKGQMNFRLRQSILFLIIFFNASVFLVYGLVKLFGIQLSDGITVDPNTLYKDVRPIEIMWDFFSLKKGYVILIAMGQIIAATSLVFKRTRFLGTILYLFIATNILAINIFFHMYIYTLTTIAVCFINCFILLYFEKDKLKSSLNK